MREKERREIFILMFLPRMSNSARIIWVIFPDTQVIPGHEHLLAVLSHLQSFFIELILVASINAHKAAASSAFDKLINDKLKIKNKK